MAEYSLAVVTNLFNEPQFRRVRGQNFSNPVRLEDGRLVSLCLFGAKELDQPYVLGVFDEDQNELARANVLENTTQIFQKLGLLVHVVSLAIAETSTRAEVADAR